MVEHSVTVNEEEAPNGVSDYMHALESAKFDQIVVSAAQNQIRSGETSLIDQSDSIEGS